MLPVWKGALHGTLLMVREERNLCSDLPKWENQLLVLSQALSLPPCFEQIRYESWVGFTVIVI